MMAVEWIETIAVYSGNQDTSEAEAPEANGCSPDKSEQRWH